MRISKKVNPEGFNYIGMWQEIGHPIGMPGKLPAISTGYRGTVLVVKSVWLVMLSLNAFCQLGIVTSKTDFRRQTNKKRQTT